MLPFPDVVKDACKNVYAGRIDGSKGEDDAFAHATDCSIKVLRLDWLVGIVNELLSESSFISAQPFAIFSDMETLWKDASRLVGKFSVALLSFVWSILCIAGEAKAPSPFRSGERIVLLGDSITKNGKYLYFLQLFEELRHPGRGVSFLNAGISGDRVDSGRERLDWDVLPLKPDRVIVMFGMNDVKLALWEGSMPDAAEQDARDKAVSGFRRELERLIDGLATAGVRCDLATPPPYDQYDAASKAVCRANGNEPGLARLAEVVRQIAAERGLGLVDVHRPLTDILKSHPELGLLRGDRIHPWWEGHLLLAVQYLEAMGEDGEVGRVELTASAAKRGFCYAPKRLPFPRLDVFWRNMERTVETAYPFEERFNREILVVKGLPAGRYAILADGREFASFDAAELAHGVNIATCDTPSQRCAQVAAKTMIELMTLETTFRDVPYMARTERSVKDLDKWLKSLEKNPHHAYYASCVKSYREQKERTSETCAQGAALRARLSKEARAMPWVITVRRQAGDEQCKQETKGE